MIGDIPDDADDDSPGFGGRGMLGVAMDEEGTVQMQHVFTGKTFEFDRNDLDEVIGTLNIFRMSLEAAEEGGEPEENGKA